MIVQEVEQRSKIAAMITNMVASCSTVGKQKVRDFIVPFELVRQWDCRFGEERMSGVTVLNPWQVILASRETPLRITRIKYNQAGLPVLNYDKRPINVKGIWPPHDRVLVSATIRKKPEKRWWLDIKSPQRFEWQTWLVLPSNGAQDFIETSYSTCGVLLARYPEPVQMEDYMGVLAILEGLS